MKCPDLITPEKISEVSSEKTLEDVVIQLEEELSGLSMDSEHWFLLYEAKVHELLNVDISQGKTARFFEKMMELGVSFYSAGSIRRPPAEQDVS